MAGPALETHAVVGSLTVAALVFSEQFSELPAVAAAIAAAWYLVALAERSPEDD
jgi:hypothetical protein